MVKTQRFSQFLAKTKPKARLVFVVLLTLFIAVGVAVPAKAQAVAFHTARNCDSNAVLDCGAMSTGELIQKFDANPSAQVIYSFFGINKQDVDSMTTTAVAGQVTKSGNVLVNGKVVAKNALTGGRQNIAGSTKEVVLGVTFFTRPPSVSFLSDSLDAFVVLNSSGQFRFAIIASCGNAVSATNVVPPPKPMTPTPTPTPPPPTSTPVVATPSTPPPTAVQVVATTPAAPVTLANTGPGPVLSIFLAVSVIGALGHWRYSRRKFLQQS